MRERQESQVGLAVKTDLGGGLQTFVDSYRDDLKRVGDAQSDRKSNP